jgi:hypothetical protein
MPERPDTSVVLATFDPPVAMAVVDALRRRGVPATAAADALAADPAAGALPGEAAVLVAPERRDEALAVLAAAMEEIAAGARDPHGGVDVDAREGAREGADDDADVPRPLLFERLRRFGGVALLLIPLLVLTLQVPPVSVRYAAVLLIGGLVVLVALRDRWSDRH